MKNMIPVDLSSRWLLINKPKPGRMFTDQMGNPMGQRPGLAAPRSSNHQKRAFMVIHCPLLGVIETGKKAHSTHTC